MKITILGCLGGFPYADQGTTSFLLESEGFTLLLDAGSGSLLRLEHYVDPLLLDAVILSHYHHDHIADVGVLQYYRQLFPKKTPVPELTIYGHTEDDFHFHDLTLKGVSKGVAYDPQKELTVGPFRITFLKTIHPVPCYAMRITEAKSGKVLVFTGDSGYLAGFIPFAEGADLFLADTYLFAGNEGHHAHFTSVEAGEIAKAAGVKKLVLTHLPQAADLGLLRRQAAEAAGSEIPVVLAEQDLVLTL